MAYSATWRSEAADDHSRVIAQCFAGADHGPGAAGLTAHEEDRIWQEASSWKGYCEELARRAALVGHEGCLRMLHELGGEAAASLAAAAANGKTPAHYPPAPSPPAPDESAGAMPVSLVDAICIVLLASAIALCLYSLHIALLLILLHFSSAYLILKKMWLHIALLLDLLLLGYLILN